MDIRKSGADASAESSLFTGESMAKAVLVVDGMKISLKAMGTTIECGLGAVSSCRVEWTSGSPDRGRKRTRFDGWSVNFYDRTGRVILAVPNAQDFGDSSIRRLFEWLDVPWAAPDDWANAQRRWLAFNLYGGLG